MQARIWFSVLALSSVLGSVGILGIASPAFAGSKTPPPSNTRISIEENTQILKNTTLDGYHDFHVRRVAYLDANAAYRAALDDRRVSYATPMLAARGETLSAADSVDEDRSADLSAKLSPASGGDENGLTEEGIRAFYAESARAYLQPLSLYKEWTKTHFHEKGRVTETTTIKLPGAASPVVTSRTLTRKELLEETEKNYQSMRGLLIQNEVTSISLAPDGKSAEVKDKSIITGLSLPVDSGSGKTLAGNGVSQCDDKVVFTAGKGVQILSSTCTSEITVSAEQNL